MHHSTSDYYGSSEWARLDYAAEEFQSEYKHKVDKVALIVAAFTGCIIVAVFVFTASIILKNAETLSGENQSTPQAEWQQGSLPELYQTDAQWATHSYANASFSETGCGPTCLTMAYVYLTGDTSISPTAMADRATEGGYASKEGTAWRFMSEEAQRLGLQVMEFALSKEVLDSHLLEGNPVVCIMGPGDFTSSGHFIVIAGLNDDGSYRVHDSNSVERTNSSWSFEQLYSQHLNAWAYWV